MNLYISNSIYPGPAGLTQITHTSGSTFLPRVPRRRLPRKMPLVVSAPFHLIASHTLIISRKLEAPFTHWHREVPITLADNINELCRGDDVRLNFVARLRSLFVRICVANETSFAPRRADEAYSESLTVQSALVEEGYLNFPPSSQRDYSRNIRPHLHQCPSHVP